MAERGVFVRAEAVAFLEEARRWRQQCILVGDALTSVESAAHKEARRRAPDDPTDRETRLSLLAVTIIDNGNFDETEAFARELLAHVEAIREGR
jgi:hypothetical protein